MAKIAIVDDEKVLVQSLSMVFQDEGYEVETYFDGISFLAAAADSQPDIILLDLRLPDTTGIEILGRIGDMGLKAKTVMITAHGDINTAIKAMKSGAYDFINKPFELDEMMLLVQKAADDIKLTGEVEHLREKILIADGEQDIIGTSEAIGSVVSQIRKVAEISDSTILIRGESGTGKELVAKAVHNLGGNKSRPFIEINCSAFPEQLLESELFGHEKGSFTDAKQRKLGLVELADGGTLFLDEAGELPLSLQAKLLRFIETRKFRRVGGSAQVKVNVRIIAASNRNIEEMVKRGEYRQDLYYRLNVIPINIPPLRERSADIMLLTDYFTDMYAKKFGREELIFSSQAKALMHQYAWPGNVRELKNLVERLVIMSSGNIVMPEDLPPAMQTPEKPFDKPTRASFTRDMNLDDYLEKVEYELIQDAIVKAKGIKSDAAELLGISRHSLKRRLQRLENGD